MNLCERHWLAAVIDCEGYIFANPKTHQYRVTVVNTNLLIVKKVKAIEILELLKSPLPIGNEDLRS